MSITLHKEYTVDKKGRIVIPRDFLHIIGDSDPLYLINKPNLSNRENDYLLCC